MIKQLLCLMVFLLAGSGVYAQEPLKVGLDPNLKPFAYVQSNGALAGFDVEIAMEVCVRLQRPCEFVRMEWDGLIPALNARKVDVLITAMSITDEREQVVDFSRPYYKSPSQLLVRKTVVLPKTVGVLRGSVDEAFARHQFKQVSVVSYGNQNEALMDLQFGRLDAVLGPRLELESGLTSEQSQELQFTGPTYDDPKFFGPGIGMAVREKDLLLAQVNAAIKGMRQDGTWQKVADRYFTVDIWAY